MAGILDCVSNTVFSHVMSVADEAVVRRVPSQTATASHNINAAAAVVRYNGVESKPVAHAKDGDCLVASSLHCCLHSMSNSDPEMTYGRCTLHSCPKCKQTGELDTSIASRCCKPQPDRQVCQATLTSDTSSMRVRMVIPGSELSNVGTCIHLALPVREGTNRIEVRQQA